MPAPDVPASPTPIVSSRKFLHLVDRARRRSSKRVPTTWAATRRRRIGIIAHDCLPSGRNGLRQNAGLILEPCGDPDVAPCS